MFAKPARSLAIAFVALTLLVGTVVAASPNPSVDPSAAPPAADTAAPAVTLNPAVVPTAKPQAEPTEKPEAPEKPEAETGAPNADQVATIVARLTAAGIPATTAQVQDLAGKVGIGGAVRVLAFAKESGKSAADILAMFQAGKGWGQIAKDLGVKPGIGSVMSNGHSKGNGNGGGNGHGKPASANS